MRLRFSRRTAILTATGAGLVILGVIVLPRLIFKPNLPAIPQVKDVVTYSTTAPSEQPIAPRTYHSTATGNQPKYIKLPAIHAEGYIQAVGLDQHGAVAVPNNINLAGWYVNTLSPGQNGLSVLDGHVNGQKLPGIFAHLAELTAGDALEVDLADGTVQHFVVKNVAQVPTGQAAAVMFSQDSSIASQLNLITCGGEFDRAKGAYNDRIIVVAAKTNS